MICFEQKFDFILWPIIPITLISSEETLITIGFLRIYANAFSHYNIQIWRRSDYYRGKCFCNFFKRFKKMYEKPGERHTLSATRLL